MNAFGGGEDGGGGAEVPGEDEVAPTEWHEAKSESQSARKGITGYLGAEKP
jgi:hypothetical protein